MIRPAMSPPMCAALSICGIDIPITMFAPIQKMSCCTMPRAHFSWRKCERRIEMTSAPMIPKIAPLAPSDGPPLKERLATEARMPVVK